MAAWIIPVLAMVQGGEQHQMVLVNKTEEACEKEHTLKEGDSHESI
jgi:hypothetical protein